ncbi:MAG: Tricarboxylate transport protein TctC [Betaproteobacteria bacterium]|jgi:tripartite-type tricarboxylate transporter receptor subunit TctC|nr:Tricarboxylate transport protein TctC [Betaproteobacteria bacterium]
MCNSRRVAKLLAGVFLLGCGAAIAQEQYPSKVIRLITAASGGNADVLGRFIQSGLTASLGQQVIVDNRGSIAPAVVAKAPPDGYTILVSGSSLWLLPLLKPGVPWDVRDFAPITLATSSPSVLVVHPSVPVKSVRQLIALARSRPGELNYAAGTLGATPHLAGELFKHMAGVNIVRVGYKGTGPGVIALMSGEVHLMFPGAPAAMPYVKQGRLRALAVCSAEPSPFAPGVPTVAASGVSGFESMSPQGIFAPAGTPTVIVNRLQQELARTLNGEDVKQKLFNAGSQVVTSAPEAFAAMMKTDIERIGKLVKVAGLQAE